MRAEEAYREQARKSATTGWGINENTPPSKPKMNKSETFQERSSAKLPPSKSKMKQSEPFQGRSRMNSPLLGQSLGSTRHGETDATVNATADCIRAFQLPPFKRIVEVETARMKSTRISQDTQLPLYLLQSTEMAERIEEVVGLSNDTFTGATSKAETVQERERNSMSLRGVSGDQNVSA
ncbi:hypothetical protein ACFX1R_010399 [Malus domestica]